MTDEKLQIVNCIIRHITGAAYPIYVQPCERQTLSHRYS